MKRCNGKRVGGKMHTARASVKTQTSRVWVTKINKNANSRVSERGQPQEYINSKNLKRKNAGEKGQTATVSAKRQRE